MVPFFSSAWSVVERLEGVVDPLLLMLKKEFVRLLNLASSLSVRTNALAESMLSDFSVLSQEESECFCAKDRVEIWLTYATACVEGRQDMAAQSVAAAWRKKAYKLANEKLAQDDPVRLRANRLYSAALRNRGEYEQALDICAETLAQVNDIISISSKSLQYELITTMNFAGFVLSRQAIQYALSNNLPAALQAYKEALSLRFSHHELTEAVFGKGHRLMGLAKNNLALIYLLLFENGDESQEYLGVAEQLLVDALEIKKAYFGTDETLTYAASLNYLGKLYGLKDSIPTALEHCHRALEIKKHVLGEGWSRSYGVSYAELGKIHKRAWELQGAIESLRAAQVNFASAYEHFSHQGDTSDIRLVKAETNLTMINELVATHDIADTKSV